MTTTTRADALAALKALNRPDRNGHEVSVCFSAPGPHNAVFHWAAIRYPLDPHDTTPTEVLARFYGCDTFQHAAAWTADYLTEHPDDGFFFI